MVLNCDHLSFIARSPQVGAGGRLLITFRVIVTPSWERFLLKYWISVNVNLGSFPFLSSFSIS
jgi:hypothetical protein